MLTFHLGIYPRVKFPGYHTCIFKSGRYATLPKYWGQFTPPQLFMLINTLYCQYFNFSHLANWWFEFPFPRWLMKLRTASGELLEKQTEMEISRQKVGGRTHREREGSKTDIPLTPRAARSWQDPLEMSCLETRRPDLHSSTDQSRNVGCPRGGLWLGVKSSLLPKAVPREGYSWRLSQKLRDGAL